MSLKIDGWYLTKTDVRFMISNLKKCIKELDSPDKLVVDWQHSAEDSENNSVIPADKNACKFCVIGKVYQVAVNNKKHGGLLYPLEDIVRRSTTKSFYEPRTLKEVHNLYKRAIRKLEKMLIEEKEKTYANC